MAAMTIGRILCAAPEGCCDRRVIEGADYCKAHNNESVERRTCPCCAGTVYVWRGSRSYRCVACSTSFVRG